jgi:hypothetical protein
MKGYEFPFAPDESVVTMFTASNYAIEAPNRAAFLIVRSSKELEFRLLPAFTEIAVKPRANSVMETPPTQSIKRKGAVTVHLSAPSWKSGRGVFTAQRPGTRISRRAD